jgi:hypothetical protein
MADLDFTLKRRNGAGYDVLLPTTTWTQVEDKPTTFTPTAHTHGNITDDGRVATNTTIVSGSHLVITNATNFIQQASLEFGTSSTSFLANNGTWVTPAGGGNVSTNGTITTNTIPFWATTSTIGSLSTATYPTLTELSYVKGVTSAIQTQLNGKAATSHASSATTFGVGTNVNYGHIRGLSLSGATDGQSGVSVVSGIAYATKTLRVSGIAQQTWGTLLAMGTTDGSLVRFVDLTLTRTEGGITYYIGAITIDTNGLFAQSTNPTPTSATRWRLNSRNSSNTQLTLPIYMYRNTGDNTLRVYVDNATSATYKYECVGYF